MYPWSEFLHAVADVNVVAKSMSVARTFFPSIINMDACISQDQSSVPQPPTNSFQVKTDDYHQSSITFNAGDTSFFLPSYMYKTCCDANKYPDIVSSFNKQIGIAAGFILHNKIFIMVNESLGHWFYFEVGY